jgi:nucleotide-binding universal stress UspA family protein
MFQSLLIPLDGSNAAEHALPIALSLGRRCNAALQIIRVHLPAWIMDPESGWYDETIDQELRAGEQDYLDTVVQRLRAVNDIPVSSVLESGFVVDTLHNHAVASGNDLVVMTTHGYGPVARYWLGSVADALVRKNSVPIFFVKPNESAVELSDEQAFKHVIIPLDGSPLSEQILGPAMMLASAMRAEITLLRIVSRSIEYEPNSDRGRGIRPGLLEQLKKIENQEKARAEQYLDELAEKLRVEGRIVQKRVSSHAQPAAGILEDASRVGADLIALATHGRGGLKRLLLGSVTDKVLRGASIPLLVYRPVGEQSVPE